MPLFSWLKRQKFTDVYRSLHLTEKTYTWSNCDAATRIDYIWLSEALASGLQKANIEEAEGLTDSDHKIITTEIWVGHIIANSSSANIRQKDQTRTIYLYKEAKQEDWEEYAKELQNQLDWKKVIKQLEENKIDANCNTNVLNLIWDTIEGAIIEAANKQIPKKKIFNTTTNRRQSKKKM